MASQEDPYFESSTYLDTKPFKDYALRVRGVIYESDWPVTIREIHEKLGGDAKPNWTADALEWISDIRASTSFPTRYQPNKRRPVQPPTPFGRVGA